MSNDSSESPVPPAPSGEREIENFPPPSVIEKFSRSFSTQEHNARTQRHLALAIFGLVAVVSLGLLAGIVFKSWDTAEAKDIAAVVLGPIVAIFGTVVGFYYGSDKR
jgi:hypothetical protein